MIREVRFTVPMRPVGKARPRLTRAGHVYTPGTTRRAEALIRDAAVAAMGAARLVPTAEPCAVTVTVGVEWPRSAWKKREPRLGGAPVTGRPDCDNILKLVADSLNGVVWLDDAQVWRAHVERRRVAQGQAGAISVCVSWEENGGAK